MTEFPLSDLTDEEVLDQAYSSFVQETRTYELRCLGPLGPVTRTPAGEDLERHNQTLLQTCKTRALIVIPAGHSGPMLRRLLEIFAKRQGWVILRWLDDMNVVPDMRTVNGVPLCSLCKTKRGGP